MAGDRGADAPAPAVTAVTGRAEKPAGRPLKPWTQGLIALICYLVAWAGSETLPLLLHPDRALLNQVSMDPNFYVWCLHWWTFAITHGLNPLHTNVIGVPAGYDLAWITSIPPLAVLTWPLTAAAGPVVSFNLLVVIAIPLSGWAAFGVCRRLTGKFLPSLAGGAIYGFSAYELNHIVAGQLNLAFAALLPLIVWLVLAWRDGDLGTRWFAALLTAALTAQYYLFNETFAGLVLGWAVALAAGYWLAADLEVRRFVIRLARVSAIAFAITFILAAPDLVYALKHVPPGFNRDPASSAVGLLNLIVPRQGQDFGWSWAYSQGAPGDPAADGYLGIPLVILGVAWAVTSWSSRLTRWLTLLTGVFLLASLGPVLYVTTSVDVRLPWSKVWYLPLARSSYPARSMVFVFLALSVVVALWLARPRRKWWLRWALAALALAAIGENTPALDLASQSGVPAFITTGDYRSYLAPGSAVAVLSGRGNAGMLWQADSGFYFRLAGGFINRAITAYPGYPPALQNLLYGPLTPASAAAFHQFTASAHLSAILVESGWNQGWPAVLTQLGLHGTTHEGVIIYPIH
jgi:hypothetical protein